MSHEESRIPDPGFLVTFTLVGGYGVGAVMASMIMTENWISTAIVASIMVVGVIMTYKLDREYKRLSREIGEPLDYLEEESGEESHLYLVANGNPYDQAIDQS